MGFPLQAQAENENMDTSFPPSFISSVGEQAALATARSGIRAGTLRAPRAFCSDRSDDTMREDTMDEREHSIRERAYRLWEEEGRPEGRTEDHWFQAKEMVAIEEGRPETFKPVDAAEAPPLEPIEALTNAGEFPTLTDQGEMQIPHRPGIDTSLDPTIDPNVAMTGEENEPVSEIETIRRTLEVPRARRGKGSPAGDRTGAMGGAAGRRVRD